MSNKLKLIIFASGVIALIIAGIIFSMNDFSEASEEKESIDNQKEKMEEKKEKQKAVLELTQEVVEIEVGSTFYYQDFISKAEDEFGFNLKDKVKVPRSIPTEHPGEYQVDYELSLPSEKKIVKQLKVKIVEYSTPTNPD